MSKRKEMTGGENAEIPLAERARHVARAEQEARGHEVCEQEAHDEFATAARESRESVLAEFWQFLRHNKKWWLMPIVLVLLLFGLLVLLSGTGAAPFIYTLF